MFDNALPSSQIDSLNYYTAPSLAEPTTLTSGAGAFTYGDYSQIIPVNTITTPYYITGIFLLTGTVATVFEVTIATGPISSESDIASVSYRIQATTDLISPTYTPAPIRIPANTRLSAKCSDDTGSNTIKIYVMYRT